jgi:hypothetical protein
MCSEEEYEKLQKGELFIDWSGSLVLTKDDDDEDVRTLDEFFDSDYLETFTRRYTTPNGDKVVAFGKYGYDG